jgi:hypothetical protein
MCATDYPEPGQPFKNKLKRYAYNGNAHCSFCPEDKGGKHMKRCADCPDEQLICNVCVLLYGAACTKCDRWYCYDCAIDSMPLLYKKLRALHGTCNACDEWDTCYIELFKKMLYNYGKSEGGPLLDKPLMQFYQCKHCNPDLINVL